MLMSNKETVNGQAHDRPCFYAFEDANTGLYWIIPISSQVSKYKNYAKIAKYKRCDTLTFGKVLGKEKAVLIQNMCPITSSYIKNEYIDPLANVPVRVDGAFEQKLLEKQNVYLRYKERALSSFSRTYWVLKQNY